MQGILNLTIEIDLSVFVCVRFPEHLINIFLCDWLSSEVEDIPKLPPVNEAVSIPVDKMRNV